MRLLTTIICILPFVYTLPVQQQQQQSTFKVIDHHEQQQQQQEEYRIEQVPSSSFIESTQTIDIIQDKYSQIIAQVMTETIQDITEVAQDSFLTIHQLQIMGKEFCRTSVEDFTHTLETKLKEAKHQLISSSGSIIKENQKEILQDLANSSDMISLKLDSLLDPDTLSRDIIKSSMYHDDTTSATDHFIKFLIHGKKYYLMNRHERNESIALNAWLHSWLTDIKYSLKKEFDVYLQENHSSSF